MGTFDLGTFNQVPLSISATDANGNTVSGVLPVWTDDDPAGATITLTDQADGSTIAVRVSTKSGTANITATVTNADGSTVSDTLTITIGDTGTGTPGAVANVTIVPGQPS